jgi:hypothetical protein
MSRASYESFLPQLQELAAGDDLAVLERARRVERQDLAGGATSVVIPAWIPSMSGAAAGGLSLFGQRIGRSGDRIYGSHVFGYVAGSRLVPRYQVTTQARRIDRAEYERLTQRSVPGIGKLAGRPAPFYFRDLQVARTRSLAFPEPGADSETAFGWTGVEGSLASFYSEQRFRKVEPLLQELPEGIDLFGMLLTLDARFVTSDGGQSHSLLAPGFLNYRSVRTRTVESRDGIYKLRPFGYVEIEAEGEREIVRWLAIFKNDRLLRVVPHTGLADWTSYIRD